MSFLQPKVTAAPAPAPPTIEDTASAQQAAADRLRARQGRASAILTPSTGAGTATTASKTLLGG